MRKLLDHSHPFPWPSIATAPSEIFIPATTLNCIDGAGSALDYGVVFPEQVGDSEGKGLFSVPQAWSGRDVTIDMLWRVQFVGTGNVYWAALMYRAYDGGTGGVVLGSVSALDASQNSTYINHVLTMGTITMGTVGPDEFVVMRILRYTSDASDTYGGNVILMGTKVRLL